MWSENDNISRTFVCRDRDYIKDKAGRFLRVLGDHHLDDSIASYVKYFPSDLGIRTINGKLYGYNSFVSKSFVILKECDGRIAFSHRHGGIITTTPVNEISSHYSCKNKLQHIATRRDEYLKHIVGRHLIGFIDTISSMISLNKIGITGSFLIDAQNDKSDIDLVCYGKDAYEVIKKYFQGSSFIQRYEDGLADILYTRRMMHMAPMDFDTLILQESRKLQGVVRGTGIHINCQPLREIDDCFMDFTMMVIGEISCIAQIVDDSQGIFAPAYYEIDVVSFVNCLFNDNSFKKRITLMISYMGDFSQVFRNGDKVFLEGKLVKIKKDGKVMFGIELSSWNTERKYKAILLK